MFISTVTIAEAAKRKEVSEAAVRMAAENHEGLLAVRCGGRIRILESTLQYYEPRNYRERSNS